MIISFKDRMFIVLVVAILAGLAAQIFNLDFGFVWGATLGCFIYEIVDWSFTLKNKNKKK